jgi:hypothetical protein
VPEKVNECAYFPKCVNGLSCQYNSVGDECELVSAE